MKVQMAEKASPDVPPFCAVLPIGDGEIERILGQEIAPCAEDDGQILRKGTFAGNVIVDELVFLGECEEVYFGKTLRDANHHFQIIHVRDVSGGVPAEEVMEVGGVEDVVFVPLGVVAPDVQIAFEERSVAGDEAEPSSAGVALLEARGIGTAGAANGKIDRGDASAELGVVEGDVNVICGHAGLLSRLKKERLHVIMEPLLWGRSCVR